MPEQRKLPVEELLAIKPSLETERLEALASGESDERWGHARARSESPILIVDDTCRVVYQTVGPIGHLVNYIADDGRLRADIRSALSSFMRQRDDSETVSLFIFVEPALLMRLRRLQGSRGMLFAVVFESFRSQNVILVAVRRYGLTRREHEILRWAFEGANAAEIAAALTISEHTVQVYFKRLLRKTNSRNRVAMVAQMLDGRASPSLNASGSG